MAFQTYKDLEIYQLSHDLAIKILYVTEAITDNDIFVSFMMRGKRKYFKSALGLCMGIEKAKKRLVACLSSDSQRNRPDNFVELEPGGESGKNELSKETTKFFVDSAKRENKEEIERIATQDKILSFLPSGKSRIKGFYTATTIANKGNA